MSIKKYNVKMIVEKEITVTVDSDKISVKFFEDFSSYMFEIDSEEQLLEHIGHSILYNEDNFVEGVGQLGGYEPNTELGITVSKVRFLDEEYEIEEIK